jgi:hypothetical protein
MTTKDQQALTKLYMENSDMSSFETEAPYRAIRNDSGRGSEAMAKVKQYLPHLQASISAIDYQGVKDACEAMINSMYDSEVQFKGDPYPEPGDND